MPSKSLKQMRYLYAHFGSAWVHQHGFDVMAPGLQVESKAKSRKKRGRRK